MNFEDTYFENAYLAQKVASKKNIIDSYGNLQICYHSNKEVESSVLNLIYVPVENLSEFLFSKGTRVPSKIILQDNTEILLPKIYIKDLKECLRPITEHNSRLVEIIEAEIKKFHTKKEKAYLELVSAIQKDRLNFNEKIRVYIGADLTLQPHLTAYVQYKALFETLKKLKFDVLYEESTQIKLLDNYQRAKTILQFKPHVVININRIRNEFLHNDTFNFIWFQDPTLILKDQSEIKLRKRDIVYHLAESLGDDLKNKNVYSTYQEICIDTKIYKKRKNIERKKKIVFIGNSYRKFFDSVDNEKKHELLEELTEHYINKGVMLFEDRIEITKRYNIVNSAHVFNYVERDIALQYISKLGLDYELEIYGNGYEKNTELEPYLKGSIECGEEVSKVYNGATYALSLTGFVMHYRVFEASSSGCIPLVIDTRKFDKSRNFDGLDKSLVFMNKIKELPQILKNPKKMDLELLTNKNSYESFIERLVQIVIGYESVQKLEAKEDMYFLDVSLAVAIALQNNRVLAQNNIVEGQQICYYDGEKQKNTPKNCIHVPLEKIVDYFSTTKNRIPTKFVGNDRLKEKSFHTNLHKSKVLKEKKIIEIKKKIKENKPNFSESTLRIFAYGCRETVLIKGIQKNIIEVAKAKNLDTYFHTQENDMQGCDELSYLEALYKFNPHITININHFNNSFLNEIVYNVVWFQDPRDILYNKEELQIRKKDFIFYTLDEFKNALIKKMVPKTQLYKQEFFTDTNNYFIDNSIKKENKIIFIGSYFPLLDQYFTDVKYKSIVDNKITQLINSQNYETSDIDNLGNELFDNKMITSVEHLNMSLYPTIGRREIIKWVCALKHIKIEIYGRGWENIKEIQPFYKGVLEKKDVNKVYNSAKYSLLIPSHSFYQQRLFEATLSGTITLAWNDPNIRDSCKHIDSIVVFKTQKDLIDKVNTVPKNDIKQITNDISDDIFIDKIIKLVEENE